MKNKLQYLIGFGAGVLAWRRVRATALADPAPARELRDTHRAYALQAALHERHFAALVAQGIGIWIGFQALINMGVNMGLLPTKGLTLPLMSFGGSGLVVNCVAIAILLRIDWETRQLMRGLPA